MGNIFPIGGKHFSAQDISSNAWEAAREWAKEAAIAWSVCAAYHRGYVKDSDPFFKERQADFEAAEKRAIEMIKIFGEK